MQCVLSRCTVTCSCINVPVVLEFTEDQEEHEDHDDVEFVGTGNGTKSDEKPETTAEKDEAGDGDKPTTDNAAAKEPEPDFTVTPSKDG